MVVVIYFAKGLANRWKAFVRYLVESKMAENPYKHSFGRRTFGLHDARIEANAVTEWLTVLDCRPLDNGVVMAKVGNRSSLTGDLVPSLDEVGR